MRAGAARGRRLWTLGAWLAFASSALSILLTGLMILVIERTASAGVASSIGANLAELATQTASRLDRGVFERYREIQLMSTRLARLKDFAQVRAELDAAKDSYRFYAWLGVTDEGGVVRAATGGLLEGVDVSARPWFSNAKAGIHLDDVHEAQLLARLLRTPDSEPQRFFDVAFPLHGGGVPTGVLGAHVSWDWAHDARQVIFGAGRGADVEPLILSDENVVLLGPRGLEGRKLDLPSVARAASGKGGYVIEDWPDGERYLVGVAQSKGFLSSPGLGWRILVRQDLDTAYEPLRHIQQEVLHWGIALAVLFSLLGWLAARAIARPLLDLADVARRIEQGEATQVQPSRAYREVQTLGSALNSLLAKVHQSAEQLRQFNAELEQRVERRTAELSAAFETLRTSQQRIHTIIESAQDPFIGMDLEGRITDWNTQAEAVFGWKREEVIGRPVSLLLPQQHEGVLEAALQEFLDTGTSTLVNHPVERRLVDRHGREIEVEVRLGLVRTGGERFFSAFVHDISQRKEVERMKDEFISTVSHELRTPLTAIYGSLNLLASGMAGELPPDAQQLLKISHDSTERLIRLINDMLDLEKIASGKIEYRMQTQPLLPLVEQALRDTRAYADGLGVRLVLAGAQDHPVVIADADRVVQVCVNLLSNAAKFSPAGDQVDVRLELRDGRARVGITDHGPGVPPEFQDRIFERFAQADASDRRAKGGTGLGLAICRSIVEAHGGRLAFTSEPNVRTEFFFELPLAAA